MKTETPTEKPTLESLGLTASIAPRGVRAMNGGEALMCAWNCLFMNQRGQQESFDYFTGSGCGVKWPRSSGSGILYPQDERIVLDMPESKRHLLKDKSILCRMAHKFNAKAKWTPDPIEILWAIARDGDALETMFEDWASESGYDADSRKAELIYRACQDNALRLKKILAADKIKTLKGLEL